MCAALRAVTSSAGVDVSTPRLDVTQSLRDDAFGGLDMNNQVAHLAHRLPGYQYVWQPAMSYPKLPLGRVEEGVAIFSK